MMLQLLQVRNFHYSFLTAFFPTPTQSSLLERKFLRLLKEAMHHGQGGKKTEMDACLKSAEHIMNSTKLNEERNRWHANFNNKSECARKLCSQYGLKPAAR